MTARSTDQTADRRPHVAGPAQPSPAVAAPNRTFWTLFVALGFAWGSTYLFIAIAIRDLSPFTLVASRLAIGTAVLGAIVAAARVPLPRDPGTYRDLAILAILNLVVPYSLTSWGQQSIDSGLASVLNATIPLFTVVLAAMLLRDEPLSLAGVAGLAIGFGGVVLLTAPSLQNGIHGTVEGEAALLLSSAAYGASVVWVRRRLDGVNPLAMAFFQVGFAFVATVPLALAFESPARELAHARPETVLSIVWLGVAASALAYVGLFRMIEGWGSTRSSTIAYILPVVGVFLGWAVLGELVDGRVLLGTALVVGGVALTNGSSPIRLTRLARLDRVRRLARPARLGRPTDRPAR